MKIASIVGARPQFIKAAPVTKALRQQHQEILVHTGQHYDQNMSQIFFDELNIPRPDLNLNVGSHSHGIQTAQMLIGIEDVLLDKKPDWVLIYGDTNSTLAGALVASKLCIPVAHVEAGLRSFNRRMPEEINRVLADRISELLFCPTETAVKNLNREGIHKGVHNVGDVMYDAILQFEKLAQSKLSILKELGLKEKSYLLATVHRAGNTDELENLKNIIEAFIECQEPIVFPVHPRTRGYLLQYGLMEPLRKAHKVILTDPVGYLEMLVLEKHARKLLTDSGGMQKEAYFFKVPCITLREETEWIETVADGWNVIVGTDKERILTAIKSFSPQKEQRALLGDGTASLKIVKILEDSS